MSLRSKKDLTAVHTRKQKVVTTSSGRPAKKEGRNGDITIRYIPKKGLFLFIKHNSRWYSIPLDNEVESSYDRDRIIVKPKKPQTGIHNSEITYNNTDDTIGVGRVNLDASVGSGDAYIASDGDNNLILKTGNSTTGNITIVDGTDGDIQFNLNGNGVAEVDGNLKLKNDADDIVINDATVLSKTVLGSGVVTSSLTSVGALDGGSITSNFGNIDNGSNSITTTGGINAGTIHASKDMAITNGSVIKISGTTSSPSSPSVTATVNAIEIAPTINAGASSGLGTQTYNLIKADLTETSTNSFDAVNLLDIHVTDSGGSTASKFKINNSGYITPATPQTGDPYSTAADTKYLMLDSATGEIKTRTAGDIKSDSALATVAGSFESLNVEGTTAPQATIAYQTGENLTFHVANNGVAKIATSDNAGGTTLAHLTLDADGDIYLDAANGIVEVKDCNLKITQHAYFDAAQSVTGTTTININWALGNKAHVALENSTSHAITFTGNPSGPCNLILKLTQNNGSDTISSWSASSGNIKWAFGIAPTLSIGSADIDIVSFYFDGTDYYGSILKDFG